MAGLIDVAFVEVLADTANFGKNLDRDIKAGLKKASKSVDDESKKMGLSLGEGFANAADIATVNFNTLGKNVEVIFKDAGKTAGENFTRDLGGKLRDSKGRFVTAGQQIGEELSASAAEAFGEGFFRDANGRLRDARGKFVSESGPAGTEAGKLFGINFGKGFGNQLAAAGGTAFKVVGVALAAAIAGPAGTAIIQVGTALAVSVGALLAAIPAAVGTAVFAITTLVLAFRGFGDVLKEVGSADAEKFNEALAKLTPNAQKFAVALRELFPQLKAIQQAVQDTFFAGLDAQLRILVGTLAGPFTAGLSGVAASFNTVTVAVAAFFGTAQSVDTFNAAFASTGRIVAALAPAIQPLLAGFAALTQATLPFVEQLGRGFADAAAQFGAFLSRISASGQLGDFLNTAAATLSTLGSVLVNLGSIFNSVFGGASAAGRTLLSSLESITGALAAFFKTPEGAAGLQAFFAAVGAASDAILSVFKPLLPLVGQIVTLFGAELVGALQALALVLTPVTQAFTDALLPVMPDLIRAAKQLAPLFAKLGAQIGGALGEALAELLPTLVRLIPIFVQILPPALEAFSRVLSVTAPVTIALATAIGALVTVAQTLSQITLGAVVAAFQFIANIDWAGVGAAIGGAFTTALTAVGDFFVQVGQFFVALPGQIGTFLAGLPGVLAKVLTDAFFDALTAVGIGIGLLLAAFILLPGKVVEAVKALPGLLADFFVDLWEDVTRITTFAFAVIVGFVTALPGQIIDAIGSLGSKLGTFFTNLWNEATRLTIVGIAKVVDLVIGIPGKLGELSNKFLEAGAKLIGAFMNGFKNVGGFIGDVSSSIVGAITGFLNDVINRINGGINQISDRLHFGLPNIPNVATGGLTTGPTVANIGEAGQEAILPLTGQRGRKTLELLAAASTGGPSIVFAAGSVAVSFEGAVPTESQARQTGEAVGHGIAAVLERRNIRTQVRLI